MIRASLPPHLLDIGNVKNDNENYNLMDTNFQTDAVVNVGHCVDNNNKNDNGRSDFTKSNDINISDQTNQIGFQEQQSSCAIVS